MNKQVIKLIENYEYPLINSIIYPNGDMLVMESYKNSNNKYILRVLCKSTIDSYFEYNSLDYVSSIFASVMVENDIYQIFAGGGSMGGDGIVYVFNKNIQEFLWFFFLDNSDVFVSAIFESPTEIICMSTSGLKIRFPIHQPDKMEVIYED
ncbi:hypothetical protein OIU80_20825 [Flavobacterium sp. LS1R47]|uniref:Uncharacterized protein n=1 Tax=Flavobacterium frigoritolerans TaxID=2987686 RepID=A0A9X3CAT0_9FLAO|nr:hypothetical protein [Flavobacterium frigoritolerans]MCV9934727.1 hypothetical protein [Flavobacterium frigoritolerans]